MSVLTQKIIIIKECSICLNKRVKFETKINPIAKIRNNKVLYYLKFRNFFFK